MKNLKDLINSELYKIKMDKTVHHFNDEYGINFQGKLSFLNNLNEQVQRQWLETFK